MFISGLYQSIAKACKGRKDYDAATLIKAVQVVCNGEINSRKAAQLYGIPRSTIYNWVYKARYGQSPFQKYFFKNQ